MMDANGKGHQGPDTGPRCHHGDVGSDAKDAVTGVPALGQGNQRDATMDGHLGRLGAPAALRALTADPPTAPIFLGAKKDRKDGVKDGCQRRVRAGW